MNSWKQFLGCIAMVASGLIIATQTRAQFPGAEGGAPPAERSVLTGEGMAVAAAPPASQTFCQCVGEAESAAVEKIERALRAPLHSTGIDFAEVPLKEVINSLQDEYGIPIKLDTKALKDIGLNTDEVVNVSLHNISLRSALRLMLKDFQLTYIIQDEVLMVTTPEKAEANLTTCVYDVSSLAGERDAQIDSIIDSIVSCVSTDTWSENGGGQAEIRPIKPGMLVISQTAAVHEEIRNLLETLRKMRAKTATNPAEAAGAAFGAVVPVEEVITRSYSLQLNPTNDTESMRSQVRDLIMQSLPGETWSGQLADGEGVALTVFNDRIVVRQTAAVQEKVQKLLVDSGVAQPMSGAGAPVGFGSRPNRSGGSKGDGGGVFSPGMSPGGRQGPPVGFGLGISPEGGIPGGGEAGLPGGTFGATRGGEGFGIDLAPSE